MQQLLHEQGQYWRLRGPMGPLGPAQAAGGLIGPMQEGFNIDGFIRSLVKETVAETVAKLASELGGMAVKRRLFTVDEAATYMGRTEEAMQHMIAGGKIPTVRIDRRVFVDVRDLDRLIDKYKA
jgi:hypothetical protein